MSSLKKFLEFKILEIDKYSLSVYDFVLILSLILIGLVLVKVSRRVIYKSERLDISKKFVLKKIIQYIITVLILFFCLKILGLNISVFLAGSAALMVGLGFGLQNLFSDFMSGLLILLDGSIKVGDVIEIDGVIYRVLDINFRTTKAIGRNEDYVILPNSHLTGNRIVNWTHDIVSSRFKISVGVDYSSDVDTVMKVLLHTTESHPLVIQERKSFVRLENFSDSSIDFGVYFFTDEIFRAEQIKSDIRVMIFYALKKNNITIPFPQRVVHNVG